MANSSSLSRILFVLVLEFVLEFLTRIMNICYKKVLIIFIFYIIYIKS
jgi:hypothetical protein